MTPTLFPTEPSDFETFWARYPKKVAKAAAERMYRRACKTATAEEILAGLDRYIASRPAWQEWAHAATWLNGRRWTDEVAAPVATGYRPEQIISRGPTARDLEAIAAYERGKRV